MQTFYITKEVQAKTLGGALRKEKEGEIVNISKRTENHNEPWHNTHAIGFDVQTESEYYE